MSTSARLSLAKIILHKFHLTQIKLLLMICLLLYFLSLTLFHIASKHSVQIHYNPFYGVKYNERIKKAFKYRPYISRKSVA